MHPREETVGVGARARATDGTELNASVRPSVRPSVLPRGDGDGGGDARACRGVAVERRGAHVVVGEDTTAWKCRQSDSAE